MKYLVLFLTLFATSLHAQKVSWDTPGQSPKAPVQRTAAYERAYNDLQVGNATYYADYLAGRTTAYGERYRPDQLTASHAELPLGTILEVRNLGTGATVRVRVNDNNGHTDGSLVVLSRQAALELGMLSAGRARVSVKRVGFDNWNPKSRAATAAAPMTRRTVAQPAPTTYTQSPAYVRPSTYAPKAPTSGTPVYRPATYAPGGSQGAIIPTPTSPAPPQTTAQNDPYAYVQAKAVAPAPTTYSNTPRVGTYTPPAAVPVYARTVRDSEVAPVREVQVATNVSSQGYAVQLAAYGNLDNARRQVITLQNQGINEVYLASVTRPDNSVIYRVLVGPYANATGAQAKADALRRQNKLSGIVTQLR